MPDLEWVPLADLLDEIARRCDGYVLALYGAETDHNQRCETWRGGSLAACLGLVEFLRHDLLTEYEASKQANGRARD